MKNKKIFNAMTTAAIASTLMATIVTPASANVTGYAVKNVGGTYSQYSVDGLVQSIATDKLLFNDYLLKLKDGNLLLQDDKAGYVKSDAVIEAIATQGKTFDLDKFTTAAAGDKVEAVDKAKLNNVKVENGKIIETPEVVKLSVASVSAITTTDVTVVLAEKPAVELTVDKFAVKANGTDLEISKIAKVDSDLTGKTYKLTIDSLAKNEGKLTVNGVEKAFDYKAPEVTSIVPKGTKSIEITFNEAIKDATAIASNFTITKAVGTITTTTIKPVLSADGTKVTITWTGNGELTIADYVLILGATATENATNRVKDVAGNSIYGGTELSFRPTADQLAVKEAASITTAEYNNGNGELTVKFNKDITAANVTATKLTLGGVALTTSDAVTQDGDNGVKITLSADTKKAVNAVTGALNLVGAKDAWTDGVNATEGQTATVTKVTPAVISSASYNQETKVLTVNFDQPVKIQTLANIKVNDATDANGAVATGATNADGTALATTAKATWELKLHADEAAKLENAANDKAKLKVYMDADAVRNDGTKVISNVDTTYTTGGVAVTYTADTTKPYIAGADFDNRTNTLKLTFSETLKDASVTSMKAAGAVKIATVATGDANAIDLSATIQGVTTIELDETKKVLTVKFGPGDPDETGKLTAQYSTGKSMKVWLAKEVLEDNNGKKNDATTFDTGVVLTYNDFKAPVVINETGTVNQTYVKVVFDEIVDKATAETATNYVITDLAGKTLEVKSAVLQADKKTVYLNTAAQVAGKPYKLTVRNVRDLQQNLVDPTENSADFYGSTAAATGKLGVNTVLTATAPVNAKNDTLAVTFDAAVDQAKALNLANYVVLEASTNDEAGWAAATAVSLSDAKAELNAAGKVATITLGNYNLQSGKFYKVVVSNVTDVYGNALDATKTEAKSVVLDAADLVAPTVVEANTKEGAVKLTFAQELNATEAAKVTNYKIDGNTISKATYAWDAEKGATVTLDLGTALADAADVLIHKNVTNLAGETIAGATYDQETNTMAKLDKPTTMGDSVAPTVDTVVAKAVADKKNDVITVTFADKDILGVSVKANGVVVKDATGTVIPEDDYDVAFVEGTAAVDAATITFNKTGDNAYNLQDGANYTVTITGVVDTSGNNLAETTKTATWADDTDKIAPTIANTGVAVTEGVAGTGTVVVTLSEDVDVATATNKDNYVVKTNSSDLWDDTATTLTPTLVTYDADTKKATIYFAEELKAAAAGNQYQVTVENVKDLAGNVQTEGNSQVKGA